MKLNSRIEIPAAVQKILLQILKNGYEAYVVGGCVRDSLLNRVPKDWDICTSAYPDQISSIFSGEKVLSTGLQHGTVTLVRENIPYEITTFRIESSYSDGRHPDSVVFTGRLKTDLLRRDFTINAMAANVDGTVIDYHGGIKDIQNGIIRCVGAPNDRFSEDSLRILRALRFSAKYGFTINSVTAMAMHENKLLLKKISQERITSEFRRIVEFAKKDLLLDFKDIISVIIPEMEKCIGFQQKNTHHKYDVYEHIATAVSLAPHEEILRLALFFHDIGKPTSYTEDSCGIGHFYGHAVVGTELTEKIMKRMRFDNNTIKSVAQLVKNHDLVLNPTPTFARRIINRFGRETVLELLEVMSADKRAQSDNSDRNQTLESIEYLKHLINQFAKEASIISIRSLAVNGNDVMAIGYPQGPEVGQILNKLLNHVLEYPDENKKDILLALASNWKAQP